MRLISSSNLIFFLKNHSESPFFQTANQLFLFQIHQPTIHLLPIHQSIIHLFPIHQPTIHLLPIHQSIIHLFPIHQPSISFKSTNQPSISFKSTNQPSISFQSTNQPSISFQSTNQPSISFQSTTQTPISNLFTHPQICDFGLARVLEPDVQQRMTQEVVTQYYRAPEILMGAKHYTTAVDMWCVA